MKLENKQASLEWLIWGSMHSDIKKQRKDWEINLKKQSNFEIFSYFFFILNPISIISINRFSLVLQILLILSYY